MSDDRLPKSLRRRDRLESIREDLEPYRNTTIEERSQMVSSLCRWASEILSQRPDGPRILAYQDPLSPESLALWHSLMTRSW